MTLQAQQSVVMADFTTFDKQWCVYEHHLHEPGEETLKVIYVGACKLANVYALADAMRNTHWATLKHTRPGSFLYVKVIMTGERVECMNASVKHILSHNPRPVCNQYGRDTSGWIRPILCSNGQEYATQQEAALALGLNQGQISQHLAGNVKSVKGFTFAYKD